MATAVKFEVLSEDLASKVHDFSADQLECYLSNATPSASLDAVKADLAEIATGTDYTGPQDTQNGLSRSGAVTSVTGVDITITANTPDVAQFRYIVLQNTTPSSPLDPLILYWDYGSASDLGAGESITIDFGTEMFTVT